MAEFKFHPSVLPSSIVIPNRSSCTIGLDVGHSLMTAVVCSDCNDGLLQYRGETSSFQQLIQELKQKYSPIRVVRITGGRSQWAKELVDAKLGIVSSLVRDTDALASGLKHVTLYCSDEEVEYQCNDPKVNEGNKYILDPNNPFLLRMRKRINDIVASADPVTDTTLIKRPCIIIECSNSMKLMLLQKDWTIKDLGRFPFGGKTFLGLAKALADENDFDRVCQMALVGERENVDTQVFEVLSEEPNSPYGLFPSKMPIFQFGKGMDMNIGKEQLKTEDLLSSLGSLIQNEIMTLVVAHCRRHKTVEINLCGPLFKTAVSKKMLQLRRQAFNNGIDPHILDVEYAAALGAMLQ